MKEKLKKIYSLTVICMIFAFCSCQEEFNDKVPKGGELVVEKVSLKDLKSPYLNQNILLVANDIKYRNLKSKENTLGKLVYDSINNFYFDDENGIYIDNGIQNSYTFKMIRPNSDGDLENIVFASKDDGTYNVYFVKYDFTEEQLKYLSNQEIENSDKEFSELVLNNNNQSNVVSKCTAIIECHVGPRDGGIDETCSYHLEGCGAGGGGGFETGSSTGSTGTGGTGSGTSGGIILTGPIGGGGTIVKTPCKKIKEKTSSTAYLNNFNALNSQTKFNLTYETGFFERKVNGLTQYAYGTQGGNFVKFPSAATGFTHVHNNHPKTDLDGNTYDAAIKMLSPADLLSLIINCSNATIASGLTPLDAYGVMISDEGIFALTIIDPNISLAQINQDNKWNKFLEKYNEKSKEILNDTSLSSSDRSEKLQEMMLGQLEFLGLKDKVALFEGEKEDGIIGGPINWTRKTLDANKKVIANPC